MAKWGMKDVSSDTDLGHGATELLRSEVDFRNDRQAINYIEAFHSAARRWKHIYERTWLETLEFLVGNQWVTYDDLDKRFRPLPTPSHRVRYTGNLMATYVTTRMARLLRENPYLHVNPATNDPEDANIAQTAKKVLRYLWSSLNMSSEVIPLAAAWLLVSGTACLKVFYDTHKGPSLSLNEDELSMLAEGNGGGEEIVELVRSGKKSVRLGEVSIEAVSPFHIYPDLEATSWEEISFLCDIRRRSLDWIRETYPGRGKKVEPESGYDSSTYYDIRMRQLWGGDVAAVSTHPQYGAIPTAIVKDFWMKPSDRYPDGLHIVVANNVVLHRSELPRWCEGELPYFFAVDKRIPGRIWGQATAEDILPIQKVRNRVISQIVETANLIGNPRLLLPVGCRVQESSLRNRPGEVIPYVSVGGLKPEYLPPPSIPAYVQELPNVLLTDIMMISGLNEPTFRSSAPANVRTASGLAQLIRQDDTRLSVVVQSFNKMLSRAGAMALKVVAYEYDVPRLAQITGGPHKFEVLQFQGKDLLGRHVGTPGANYFNVDVRVDTGHRSKIAQQEFLLNAAQAGLVNVSDPAERRWLLRMLDIGAPDDELFGDMRITQAQAKIEERIMAQSSDDDWETILEMKIVGPHSWDVHEEHIESHLEFMRRPEFLRILEDYPDRALRFQAHVEEHRRAIQEQVQQAPGIGPQLPGLPPQAGVGSPFSVTPRGVRTSAPSPTEAEPPV